MPDASELIKAIKKTTLDAVYAAKPADFCFGTVTSARPLKILVEQKLTLGEEQLVLTKAVTDHWVDIEVNHFTVNDNFMNPKHKHGILGGGSTDSGDLDSTHKHGYKGRKKIMIHNGLREGEKVILARFGGGQRFLVLDRACEHTTIGEWV